MKVVLFAAHQLAVESEVSLNSCLGVLSLAAILKEKEVDFEVLDFFGSSLFHVENADNALDTIIERILDAKPEILGISTMSNNLVISIEICRILKERKPSVYIVLGGPGSSFAAEEIMKEFQYVDAIIRGEAEISFVELVEALIKGGLIPRIPGLLHRVGELVQDYGVSEAIEELDDTPIPLYELCKTEFGELESASLEVGRGCPYNCSFCCTANFFRRKYRVKSVERVLREIDEIQKRSDDMMIIFNHDLLTHNRKYILELCDAILSRAKPVKWGASVRFDTIDFNLLRRMKKAGCHSYFIGLEVTTQKLQKIIRKNLKMSELQKTIDNLLKLKLTFAASLITGFPEETLNDLKSSVSWMLKLKALDPRRVHVQMHTLCPLPGSSVYEDNKTNLIYDDHGSPGHTDFPQLYWTRMREIIRRYPNLFPVYYHLQTPHLPRRYSVLASYLARIIDDNSTSSIIEAYREHGEDLVEEIFEKIEGLDMPKPGRTISEIIGLMDSLRKVIIDLYRKKNISSDRFETASQVEEAMNELLSNKRENGHRMVYSKYDPVELMDQISGRKKNPPIEGPPGYHLFIWDAEDKMMKSIRLPDHLSAALET